MARRLSIGEKIQQLRAVLGEQFVVILSGLGAYSYESTGARTGQIFTKMRRSVEAWESGEMEPPADVARRYEIAYSLVDQLQEAGCGSQIRAWFTASQPELDDEAPILFLAGSNPRGLDLAERRLNDCINAFVSDSFG